MAEQTRVSPPYIGFGSFTGFINQLRETAVPQRIDRSVFGNASGGMAYGLLSSLKFLKLIDERGSPSAAFRALIKASDSERAEHLRLMLELGYPEVFSSEVDLQIATSGQFDELLRDRYEIKGSTIDKAAIFFLAAAKQAGIAISPQLEKRKPIATANGKRLLKGKKEASSEATGSAKSAPPQAREEPRPADAVSTLVSIIDMAEMSDDEQAAVWTLIRYLKKREAIAKSAGGGSDV